nr:uncharacterized protein LOC110358100 [Columba livia]
MRRCVDPALARQRFCANTERQGRERSSRPAALLALGRALGACLQPPGRCLEPCQCVPRTFSTVLVGMGQVNCCRGSSCRAVKELWVSALLGPPEGVEGARVTQMPSFKQLLKELRGRNAAMTLHTSSLERLVESQAKAGAVERPPPVVPSGSEAGVGHLAAGGTPGWRRWLPWPFGQRGTPSAAEAGWRHQALATGGFCLADPWQLSAAMTARCPSPSRTCWLSCRSTARPRRGSSGWRPASVPPGSCGRPWTAAPRSSWKASRCTSWPPS